MRWLSALFIVPFVVAMTGCPVSSSPTPNCDQSISTSTVELGLSYQPQQCTQLCWAGSIAMVAQYFGRPVAECQLAREKLRLATGYLYDCCNVNMCADQYCNVPAYVSEVATLFTEIGIRGNMLSRPLTEEELQIELSQQRPVMVFYQGNQSGHYAVISGFSPGYPASYHVDDPWPTAGSLSMPYASIRQGPNNENWYMTYAQLTTGASVCQ